MYSYSPFVSFRLSPKQPFTITPDKEFGFGGILCEIYRKETGLGKWELMGFVDGKVYHSDGMWMFVLGDEKRFGVPPTAVLEYFGFSLETYALLESSASAANGATAMFHFLPRAKWNFADWQVELYYPKYLEDCKRLHQTPR